MSLHERRVQDQYVCTPTVEERIRAPLDNDVYECVKETFPRKTDVEIIAELMRMIVIVAVCYNDVVEDGQDPATVFERHIFVESDELAEFFPWPDF